MTDSYQQLKKSYFEQYPGGRLQFRGHHDMQYPDYSERRGPFIYKLVSQPVCSDEPWRDSPDDVWEYDETMTQAIWKEDYERFNGLCHTYDCETKVNVGVSFCDPCLASYLLTSSLVSSKVPPELIELAQKSPVYQRLKGKGERWS